VNEVSSSLDDEKEILKVGWQWRKLW